MWNVNWGNNKQTHCSAQIISSLNVCYRCGHRRNHLAQYRPHLLCHCPLLKSCRFLMTHETKLEKLWQSLRHVVMLGLSQISLNVENKVAVTDIYYSAYMGYIRGHSKKCALITIYCMFKIFVIRQAQKMHTKCMHRKISIKYAIFKSFGTVLLKFFSIDIWLFQLRHKLNFEQAPTAMYIFLDAWCALECM